MAGIDTTSPHYKGKYASIYEVNKAYPSGGSAGDYVDILGFAHYWNPDRNNWCVNEKRDEYWDELMASAAEEVKRSGRNPFVLHGYYLAHSGAFYTNEAWRGTPKLRISKTIDGKQIDRVIKGRCFFEVSGGSSGAAFYDADGVFISSASWHPLTRGYQDFVIEETDIPDNAEYVAFGTLTTDLAGSWIECGTKVSLENTINNDLTPKVKASKQITDYIARFDKEWFSVDGVWDATGKADFPYSPLETKSTPLLPLTNDVFVRCWIGTSSSFNKYGIVFFDEDKQIMSGVRIYAQTPGLTDVHLTAENIPMGAKFFSAPTLNSSASESYVEIRIDEYVLSSIDSLWSSISGIGTRLNGIDRRLDGIDSRIDDVDDKIEDTQDELIFSDALAGLVFNKTEAHQLAKTAIKAVWLTYGPYISSNEDKLIADALYDALKTTELYITSLKNISGQYGCFIQVMDAATNGTNCFSKFVAGVHTITGTEEVWNMDCRADSILYPSGSTISTAPFAIHFAIDWNELNNKTVTVDGINPIQITFGELNWGERKPFENMRDRAETLTKEVDDLKTIVDGISIKGNTIVCFGDSLTEMVDTTNSKHYSDYMAEWSGANFINVGIGGSQLRQRSAKVTTIFDSTEQYASDDKVFYRANDSEDYGWYVFLQSHTGAWTGTDVLDLSYEPNVPNFNENTQYHFNDKVKYNGRTRVFKTEHIGAWVDADVYTIYPSILYGCLDIINMVESVANDNYECIKAAALQIRDYDNDDNIAIVNRLSSINWSKVDAITVFAGTNDWYNANTLGTTGSTAKDKTLGAINEIIRVFLTAYPHIKIYWFTPVVRWVSNFNLNTNPPTIDDTMFGDNYSIEGNNTLKEECTAIMQEVTKNHIPVCDMYNNFGWNKYNCTEFFTGTDGTHPRTVKGVMYLANKILNFIYQNKTF